MPAKRPKAKPARKAAAKPKPSARPTATRRKSPVQAFKGKPAARTQASPRKRAVRPTCPICGSRDVETVKPAAKAKAQRKLAAGVVLPFLVEHHGGMTCHSCGYRDEAVA